MRSLLGYLGTIFFIKELSKLAYQKDKFFFELLLFAHHLWQFIIQKLKSLREIYLLI
ncbi:unnamed protein product [Paramecium pentaurelia]|uniref:Uncharacterized protein n=1 Tax=Paramecium pentaurelia TaxID=43138 RepID=A0A8S1YIF2_9CILI|nr:unnamed protein product [Paramecium pentaurelia]